MNTIIACPHCNGEIQILELKCGIFRHAMYKNGKEFEPHAPKELCDKAIEEGLVFGCGKPFRIIKGSVEKCDYI